MCTLRHETLSYESFIAPFVVESPYREVHPVTQVFLNYRAADKDFGVHMLDRALSDRFGADAVFLASRSIPLGAEWESQMFDAVRNSDALLAIMGRNWLDAADERGNRLIDRPEDFLRRELELAHELHKKIIPVRLDTPRLTEQRLPAELAWLAGCQDIEIRFRSANLDVDRLVDKLKLQIPELGNRAPQAKPQASTKFSVTGTVHGSVYQVETMRDLIVGPTVHDHRDDGDVS